MVFKVVFHRDLTPGFFGRVPAFLPWGEPGHGPLRTGLERLLPQRLQPPPALGLGEGTLQDTALKNQGHCSVLCTVKGAVYTI